MERYFPKQIQVDKSSVDGANIDEGSSRKKSRVEFNLENLNSDPGERPPISSYDINIQDIVRRAYLQKGPCQPRGHNFPFSLCGNKSRRFCPSWFDGNISWLEYSVSKDAIFCLCCYVFPQDGAEPTWISRGFRNWKDKKALARHVGTISSPHNKARMMCDALMNQNQSIKTVLSNYDEASQKEYRIRLGASIDCIRWLLHQGLAFRGHDESDDSSNKGNFLELLQFLAEHNDSINKVVLDNAPENNKMTSPKIQKEIVSAIANEATEEIIKDIGDDLFTVLIDESCDVSMKEQMAVVLRYVNVKGEVIERFLNLVHVSDTTAKSLKAAMDSLFLRFGLSTARLRGQGYDGASNMKGEFNGLKALILKENNQAYYVHCFSHQLQLILVAIAQGHHEVCEFYSTIANILNVVGGSSRRHDILRAKEHDRVSKLLCSGQLESGRGLNQELGLKRAGDTRWGSHYASLLNLTHMFESIIDVLDYLTDDGFDPTQRGRASTLSKQLQTFDFIFLLHLMKSVLAKTNDLSQALQKKDQDIIHAMKLVELTKELLRKMRNDDGEWESFLQGVVSFCGKFDVDVPNMGDDYKDPRRSRRRMEKITNLHHFRYELYNTILDWVLNELNDRFNEANTELLLCVACLDPSNGFASFDKQKLIRLAEFYPNDFSPIERDLLDTQLDLYIMDMRSTCAFSHVNNIGELAKKLVELKKNVVYPLVFLLLKLAMLLLVATANVERVFSAMKIIKTRLRNRMSDEWMNDCLVCYIEKDVTETIDNEAIMRRFQNMSTQREVL